MIPAGINSYSPNSNILRDRIILVTGASDGIGKAVAINYAAHGATVILLAPNLKKLEQVYDAIESAGYPQPAIYPMNLESATAGDYEDLATNFEKEFGRLPPLPFITNAYDAMAVIGLAAHAAKVKGVELTSGNIRDNLRAVANPPGEVVKPGEFIKAVDLLDQGKKINYEGAAGSVDFDQHGDVITPIEVWQYSNGNIMTVKIEHEIPVEEDITRQKPEMRKETVP